MRIARIEPFILHIPVTGGSIADSTHRISHWGVVGAKIVTEEGLEGYGFTGTHADLPSDRLITACIRDCYAPLLVGEDASESNRLWLKLARHPALQWVGRAGITQLALAAVDVALWDLKAKKAGVPLWHLARRRQQTATRGLQHRYRLALDPEGPARSRAADRLWSATASTASRSRSAMPIPASTSAGSKRCARPSDSHVALAIDGNGKWDLPTCKRFCARAEPLDIFWFEEPLWYDDVGSHAALARATRRSPWHSASSSIRSTPSAPSSRRMRSTTSSPM